MKKLKITSILTALIITVSMSFLSACSSDDDANARNFNVNQPLTETDKDALLFMLEEEKLARDTYIYLNNEWSLSQFNNIKDSEQMHMDAVENLLTQYNVAYTILPLGEFQDNMLQDLYDQFIIDGTISQANALQIGATIEDLDIVDLEDYINATSNTNLIRVFEKLQCGSRNHLRSFVSAIENAGDTYTPQYLSQEDYNSILVGSHEQCN
ncbi:DUF2202 domain-containing protein [Mangrovimonas spongiae]|uniref:DUF2202 domain-containing protein n=1 Tax=Mangrovimonas spongiae TaxID=2494697 RepID=A0A428K1X7_9FLAO|nr:DUF2202 domain-containing protein [Mangrovimonas spongiae]RSK40363.1 DUF2202 domain-containing protein [Mangrovimonas spongiae]